MVKLSKLTTVLATIAVMAFVFSMEATQVRAFETCSLVTSGSAVYGGSDYWFQAHVGTAVKGEALVIELINRDSSGLPWQFSSNMYSIHAEDSNTQTGLGEFWGVIEGQGTVEHRFTVLTEANVNLFGFTDEAADFNVFVCNTGNSDPVVAQQSASLRSPARINTQSAPVAVYGNSTDIHIYAVNPDTAQGMLSLTVSRASIETTDIPTEANVLLAEGTNPFTGHTVALYRLTTGWYQLNTSYADGKPFVFAWNDSGETEVINW